MKSQMTDRETFAREVFPTDHVRNNALSSANTRIWHVQRFVIESFQSLHTLNYWSKTDLWFIEISCHRKRISSLERKKSLDCDSNSFIERVVRIRSRLSVLHLSNDRCQMERYRVDIRIWIKNHSLSKCITTQFACRSRGHFVVAKVDALRISSVADVIQIWICLDIIKRMTYNIYIYIYIHICLSLYQVLYLRWLIYEIDSFLKKLIYFSHC